MRRRHRPNTPISLISEPRRVTSLKIQGYRPFGDFSTRFGPLEIMVGANASGKSSLFEFLKFLRDSVLQDIPPEIVAGSIGQQIFHRPGPERFWWSVEIDLGEKQPLRYQGEVIGPVGRAHVSFERVQTSRPFPGYRKPLIFMNVRERLGYVRHPIGKLVEQRVELRKPTQLALSTMTNPVFVTLYNLREYISRWRFYSSFNIANQFLCWATLCVQPNPPTLICVDEPEGVHPRTLPILAGLFKEASQRTQILLATHASYFLTQFGIEEISVMKKIGGESKLLKPSDSKSLRANLEEFGVMEIEAMHRSDELEVLS